LHGSAALSDLALACGIRAQIQVQAAVGVHDTIRMSVPSPSLTLGLTCAHSLIQGIVAHPGLVELVPGHMPSSPLATGAVRLGDTSAIDGSEGALSNPESHTFGLPVVGGPDRLLPRHAGVRVHTLEGDPGRLPVSVSSSSSAVAAAAVETVMSVRARRAGR
jgi:hypothetical protein